MLRIRLQRIGKKKAPVYRMIVSEREKDTQAGTLETLGKYNPVLKDKVIDLNVERIKHWISMGAQPSNTVHNLLVNAGILSAEKAKAITITKKRRGKLDEKKAADEEAKSAATAAASEEVVQQDVPENEDEPQHPVESAPEETPSAQEESPKEEAVPAEQGQQIGEEKTDV